VSGILWISWNRFLIINEHVYLIIRALSFSEDTFIPACPLAI
jgi:hypothetical protein